MKLVDFSKLKRIFTGSSVTSRLQAALEQADRRVESDVGAAYNILFKAIQKELEYLNGLKNREGFIEWLQGQQINLDAIKPRKRA